MKNSMIKKIACTLPFVCLMACASQEPATDLLNSAQDAMNNAGNAQECADPFENCGLQHILEQAKSMAQGVTVKGIRCLELTIQGYSSQEIGTIVQAEAATVRMWMTKARRFLRSLPELRDYLCLEVA